MKGSKRHRWYKDGVKTSRRWYKRVWNRKVRHNAVSHRNSSYKKIAGVSMWDGIL